MIYLANLLGFTSSRSAAAGSIRPNDHDFEPRRTSAAGRCPAEISTRYRYYDSLRITPGRSSEIAKVCVVTTVMSCRACGLHFVTPRQGCGYPRCWREGSRCGGAGSEYSSSTRNSDRLSSALRDHAEPAFGPTWQCVAEERLGNCRRGTGTTFS
jgi:hypothetical protein